MNARRNQVKSTRRNSIAVGWDPGNLQAWWPDSLAPTPPPADWLLMETWVEKPQPRPYRARKSSRRNPFPEVVLISAED